jgi:hypothetical protein
MCPVLKWKAVHCSHPLSHEVKPPRKSVLPTPGDRLSFRCAVEIPWPGVAELFFFRALRMRLVISIVLAGAFLVGCQSQPTRYVTLTGNDPDAIYDFTPNRSATCEVHGIVMSPHVVVLEFGMKFPTETMTARRELFPHADEPYDTGICIPMVERRGRVFVCTRCTEARTRWISTHKTESR